MPAGRPPDHPKVRLMRNPNKRVSELNEKLGQMPEPELGMIEPPPVVKGEALEEWKRIVPMIDGMKILGKCDYGIVTRHCLAWARFIEAELKLAADGQAGMVLRTASGYPVINPWWVISNKAQEEMHKCMSELGLSPRARTSIKGDAKVPDLGRARAAGAGQFLA